MALERGALNDIQGFPLNGAMLNGSSLLLVQNVSGHIELSSRKISWILVQLPISPYWFNFWTGRIEINNRENLYLKVFVSVALRGMFLKSHNYYRGELKRQKELMRIRLNVEGLIHLPGLRLFLSRSSVATIKATWSTDRSSRARAFDGQSAARSLPSSSSSSRRRRLA